MGSAGEPAFVEMRNDHYARPQRDALDEPWWGPDRCRFMEAVGSG